MRKLDSFAPERAGPDHILSLLRRLRLDWLLRSFSASTRAITLRVCEWLRHHWFAGAIGASEPQSICVSIARAYRLSSVLLAASKNVQPTKHDFRSRYRNHLRLWGVRCHRCRSAAVRGAPRYLLAKNFGGGAFAVGHRSIDGSSRG